MAYPKRTDRGRILAAALEQVNQEGEENLTIRAVAARLQLAPNAIYRYFISLAALEAAVAEEARLRIHEVMTKAASGKGHVETIHAISEAYIRFAEQKPRLFALYLKTYRAAVCIPQCLRDRDFFSENVARLYGEQQASAAALALWAHLHGTAVLLVAGLIPTEQAFTSLTFGLQLWTSGAQNESTPELREGR